jgi:glycosyltransferase involved in cell wall biosynthesis
MNAFIQVYLVNIHKFKEKKSIYERTFELAYFFYFYKIDTKTRMIQPAISVLMPNYNNEPFLRDAIDSVLNQTFTDFIFIIIDDGSTDKSVDIIRSYSDKRILLIEKKNNSGIVDTLNIGLEQVTSKYFIRMDGDDISTVERFALLYQFMENNPDIGVCGSNIKIFGSISETWRYSSDKDKCKARLIFNNGVGHASTIVRTEVLKNNGITYSNKHPYMEDYELFSQLKRHTEFTNIDKELYQYRISDHNSTVKNNHTRLERYRDFYKYILNELSIEPTQENVETHLEFFLKPSISFPISTYKKWLELLIIQNKKKRIYPGKALEEILTERWEHFFFKTVPLPLHNVLTYFLISKKIKLNQASYLLKYKINKLIGRK